MREGSPGPERRGVALRKLMSVFVVAVLAAMLLPAVSATAGGPAKVDFVVTDTEPPPGPPGICRADDPATECSRFDLEGFSMCTEGSGVSEAWVDESHGRRIQMYVMFRCTNVDGSTGPDGFNLKLGGKMNSKQINWVFYGGTETLSGVHGGGGGTVSPSFGSYDLEGKLK